MPKIKIIKAAPKGIVDLQISEKSSSDTMYSSTSHSGNVLKSNIVQLDGWRWFQVSLISFTPFLEANEVGDIATQQLATLYIERALGDQPRDNLHVSLR